MQAGDAASVLALQCLPSLLAAAAVAFGFPAFAWPAAAVAMCSVSPLPAAVSLPLPFLKIYLRSSILLMQAGAAERA